MRQPRDRTTGVLAKGAVLWALATWLAGGCGPVEYINQVAFKAASAVAAAKEAEADRYAPYEFTAAQEYLHKAREEAAYAQYQDSIEFGRKAEELAHRARAIAMTRFSQPAAPPPAPPPASTTTSTSTAMPPETPRAPAAKSPAGE